MCCWRPRSTPASSPCRCRNMPISICGFAGRSGWTLRQAEGRRLRPGARGQAIRLAADHRSRALSVSLSAGAGLVSPPHAGDRQRRSDQGDLLDIDRRGVRVDPLSDPAGKRLAATARPMGSRPMSRARSITSASTGSTRRATSTCRRISRSSSPASTTDFDYHKLVWAPPIEPASEATSEHSADCQAAAVASRYFDSGCGRPSAPTRT